MTESFIVTMNDRSEVRVPAEDEWQARRIAIHARRPQVPYPLWVVRVERP